ncbi:hypothetical protein [Sinomonas humi]|nr:hypothetical protein [Sinomonas humi]
MPISLSVFAVGRYVNRSVIAKSWGRGFVHIKLLGDLPVGSGRLSEARRAAGYLSKYVAKTFTDPQSRDLGRHRYDVAQGFQPVSLHLSGTSAADVLGRPQSSWAPSRTGAGPPRTCRTGPGLRRSGLSGVPDGRSGAAGGVGGRVLP